VNRRRISQLLSASLAAFAIPFAVVVGALVTGIAAYEGTATAHTRADLRHLGYGYPLRWVRQDQRQYTPQRYPQPMAFDNPMQSPTSVAPGRMAADVAIVSGVVLASLLLVAGGIRLAGGRAKSADE
jgi:hypothetical protein